MARMLLLLGLAACGRLSFDATSDPQPPRAFDLLVSRTDDRMAGPASLATTAELPAGTLDLSLREAVTIARNHPGPDVIGFDPQALPPGTTVTIGSVLELADTGTTIDANGAGITVACAAGYAGTLLRVTGASATLDGVRLTGCGIGIEGTQVTGLVIRRVEVAGTGSDAVFLDGGTGVTIEDSRIDRAGGIAIHGHGLRESWIQRNQLSLLTTSPQRHGIELEDGAGVHVIDNLVTSGSGNQVSLITTSDSEVVGNMLEGGAVGIGVFGASQRSFLFRNVVIAPRTDPVYVDAKAIETAIVHNTFFRAPELIEVGTSSTVASNLAATDAARFVDPASYDFHLHLGDPGIDAADDRWLDMLPEDPAWFLGNNPDLGAVESY